MAWKLAIPVACLAVAGQLVLSGTASATRTLASARSATTISSKINLGDCNATFLMRLCTDPHGKLYDGHLSRFRDPITGAYVGHDEPSVKFISSRPGSANTFTYGMRLSRDPARAPTASGSVTSYGELSVTPWFGLPMCDPNSYPLNPCTPLSDSNTGLDSPTDAGSAFMELQFYPPGFTPFIDSTSCSRTRWCAALTIDSLECTFGFATCNNNCIEPVNFAFLQTNGVPAGPPAPDTATAASLLGNRRTLKMNPGDRVTISVSDVPDSGPPDRGGLKASATFPDGSSYTDPNVFQTCTGGQEGKGATGEGPCDPNTGLCQNATTQGADGPVACPTNDSGSGALCEFPDGFCFPRGSRPVTIDGIATTESSELNLCYQDAFQNGDLDFDGTGYLADWPDGSRNHPTSIAYTSPLSRGHPYPQMQFETNVAASEALCDVVSGGGCTAPPAGAAFYPFWSLTNQLSGTGACVWNFGNDIANVTTNDFGRDAQYGTPDVARFAGTLTSPVMANPALAANCAAA